MHRPLFPGQQENETIHMVLRPHWFIFFLKFLSWLLFAAILILIDWAINQYAPNLKNTVLTDFLNLFKSVYLLFLMLGLLILWIMYYLNMQIITNERIVDVTQKSLLHHTISELNLTNIEDVTAEVRGVFGTFLDYGSVYVQTAAETERFVFDNVPNPAAVEKMILDLYEKLPEHQKAHE